MAQLTKDQWSQYKYRLLGIDRGVGVDTKTDPDGNKARQAIYDELSKQGYIAINGSWKLTIDIGESRGDKYTDVKLRGGDPIAAMAADNGITLTSKEAQEMTAAYNEYANNKADPYDYAGFSNLVAQNPGALSASLADRIKLQKEQDYITQQTADPNAPATKLKNLQESELTTKLTDERVRAVKDLADILSARGIGQSGALVGGTADIEKSSENALSSGINQINQEYEKTLQAGATGAGTDYMTDVANTVANEYQKNMADRYYEEIKKLANAGDQEGLLELLGTVGGGIYGAVTGGPLGATAGANIGSAAGKALTKLSR